MAAIATTQRTVRLRTEQFDAQCQNMWPEASQRQIANLLGIHHTTLSQYRTGRRAVGGPAIATILHRLPGARFDALFEVTGETADETAPDEVAR